MTVIMGYMREMHHFNVFLCLGVAWFSFYGGGGGGGGKKKNFFCIFLARVSCMVTSHNLGKCLVLSIFHGYQPK